MRALLLALALAGCAAAEDPTPKPTPAEDPPPFAEHPLMAPGFWNIAHRGGGRLAPEETLVAYANAVDIGADVLEADLHATSDGVIVCMHDDTVDRTTDGSGEIRTMSWAEVSTLDAGYRFSPDGGATFPHRGQGVTVPTLSELLDAFPDQLFSLELKPNDPDLVDPVLQLLAERGLTERVVLMSFFPGPINAVRAADPEVLTALSTGEMLDFWELSPYDEDLYEPPGYHLHLPPTFGTLEVDAAKVEQAHRLHMAMHLWTLNDRDELEAAIDLGVDGVFTDDPRLLDEILQERGL